MQTYLVGGAVRDELLGLDVKDRDWVVVGATPEQMRAQGFRQVGADFPVFLHPRTQEEYALARTERKQGRGYHGFTVYSAPDVTLEQDLQRRDLTINAMALDRAAHEDVLTGLHNRRHAEFALPLLIEGARVAGQVISVAALDVDHFKKINDTYGHVAGDMVLREFARLLRPRVRNSEFFARYGGEEFAFVLPESDLEGSKIFAEAVRRKVEVHPFVHGDVNIQVTVSVGGAAFTDEIESIQQMIESVDQKLYEAKNTGRNRVCF